MKRRSFTLIAGVSFIIFSTFVAGWVATRNDAMLVSFRTPTHFIYIEVSDNGIRVDRFDGAMEADPVSWGRSPQANVVLLGLPKLQNYQPGIGYTTESGQEMVLPARANILKYDVSQLRSYRGIVVDWWLVFLMTSIFPAVWAIAFAYRRYHARQRADLASRNCCTACGYDLRATPGRCPECGAVPSYS